MESSFYSDYDDTFNYNSTSTIYNASASATIVDLFDPQGSGTADATIVYFLIAGVAGIFGMLVIAAKFLKNPNAGKSRFGRKNSFGTLNTVVTTNSK